MGNMRMTATVDRFAAHRSERGDFRSPWHLFHRFCVLTDDAAFSLNRALVAIAAPSHLCGVGVWVRRFFF